MALHAQERDPNRVQVSGFVINAATGERISGALVNLASFRSPAAPETQRAVTDADGKFSFSTFYDQRIELRTSRRGYRSESGSDTSMVALRPPDVDSVVVRLVPVAAIEGRIVNSSGEPIPGITVEAIRGQISDGRRDWRTTASARTDDRGIYRLWGMMPGNYYLKVVGSNQTTNVLQALPQTSNAAEAYGPVYYPSESGLETARLLIVGPGQNLRADFTVEGQPAHRVQGALAIATAPVIVLRVLRGDDPVGVRSAVNVAAKSFELFDITRGVYTIQAYAVGASRLIGETTVIVTDRDLFGVNITMRPVVDVPILVEPGERLSGATAVSVSPNRQPPALYRGKIFAERNSEGTLVLRGLPPGRYDVNVSAANGKYVKSVTSGDTDVLENGLTVGATSPSLRIQLAEGGGTILAAIPGVARNDTATVALVRKNGSSGEPRIEIASEGLLIAENLAPGDYTVYAWRSSQQVEYRNPQALAAYSDRAVRVSLKEGDKKEIGLQLIPEGN